MVASWLPLKPGAPPAKSLSCTPAWLRNHWGISRPEVELSEPKVKRLPSSTVSCFWFWIGLRPLAVLAMNTLVKAASMSRWAITWAPGFCSRACTPVRPPNHTRSRLPVRKALTAAA